MQDDMYHYGSPVQTLGPANPALNVDVGMITDPLNPDAALGSLLSLGIMTHDAHGISAYESYYGLPPSSGSSSSSGSSQLNPDDLFAPVLQEQILAGASSASGAVDHL
jgi:hypothetical protein